MGRKRQEKQRSEPQSHGGLKVEVRDQNLRTSENSRNIGMMEKQEYRRQKTGVRQRQEDWKNQKSKIGGQRTDDR
jgi:hypothetical protein